MDARRRHAWEVLGLGPVWRARAHVGTRADDSVDDETADDEPARVDRRDHRDHVDPLDPLDDPRADPVQPQVHAPSPAPVLVHRPAGLLPSLEAERDAVDLDTLRERVAQCTRCGLCSSRTQTVFGTGIAPAPWMLIGEAPGQQEDRQGEPFVGQAGRLLDRMMASVGASRTGNAFVANVLKCRPPNNRNPLPEEIASCRPYLLRQIELVRPGLLLLLGRFASHVVLDSQEPMRRLRGRVHQVRVGDRLIPAVCTWHPAYLLRNLDDKASAWRDLMLARDTLDEVARRDGG